MLLAGNRAVWYAFEQLRPEAKGEYMTKTSLKQLQIDSQRCEHKKKSKSAQRYTSLICAYQWHSIGRNSGIVNVFMSRSGEPRCLELIKVSWKRVMSPCGKVAKARSGRIVLIRLAWHRFVLVGSANPGKTAIRTPLCKCL